MASNKIIPMPEPKGLSPEDRTRWLVRNDPEMLDEMAFSRWHAQSDIIGSRAARQAWDALSPERRADHCAATMEALERYWAMTPDEQAQENRRGLCRAINKNDAAFTEKGREREATAMKKLGFERNPLYYCGVCGDDSCEGCTPLQEPR